MFRLPEVIEILVSMSTVDKIEIITEQDRLRPIDADYQMFDNAKIKAAIDWRPQIPVRQMLGDLLNHWRSEILKGKVPLDR